MKNKHTQEVDELIANLKEVLLKLPSIEKTEVKQIILFSDSLIFYNDTILIKIIFYLSDNATEISKENESKSAIPPGAF